MSASGFAFRYTFVPTPRFEYISPAVRDIVGYRPEDFYSDPDLDLRLVHPDDRVLYEELIRRPDHACRLRCITKEGETLWIELNPFPVVGDGGHLLAVDGVVRLSDPRTGPDNQGAAEGEASPALAKLSARERQVLELAALGWTDAQIGQRLGISPRTIERHMRHIFFKLRAPNRTAAVAMLLTGRFGGPAERP
jgi:DNA-binding CsgD family transcriptional regulator